MPDNFIEDNIIEKLVRYTDGESSAEEIAEVGQLLQQNEAVCERYENIVSAKAAIRSLGLQQRIGKLHRDYHAEKQQNNTRAVRPKFTMAKTFLRVAAVLIFFVGGYGVYEYATVSNESVFEKNYIGYQLPVLRGEQNENITDSLYRAGKFAELQKIFEQAAAKTQHDYFIAGLSYLETNNAAEAIQAFTSLQRLNNSSAEKYFVQETEFYLALAYIKNGNVDEAEQLLHNIQNSRQHIFYNKASEISSMQLQVLKWKK